jgi:hypothetical protein
VSLVKDAVPEAHAPKGGHLAVLTNAERQEVMAIERGHTIFIIEDPKRADKIFRFILVSATNKRLVLKCHCGNPKCTAVYTYTASKRGQHLSPSASAADAHLQKVVSQTGQS